LLFCPPLRSELRQEEEEEEMVPRGACSTV